ncbi:MAG: hypothetical protein ACI8RZ_005651 [Myxococcota bacterium]|jgi:hypothetical protein
MARTSVIANLGKMLKVKSGIEQGLSTSKACKAAGTSSGTYKKWLERYAAHKTPIAVAPLAREGAFQLSGDGRYLFVLNFGPEGLALTRVDTATAAQISHHIHHPSEPYSYRAVMAVGTSQTGDRMLLLLNKGELLWWTPETGEVEESSIDLKDRVHGLGSQTSSGVRRWTTVAFSADLSTVAFWHTSTESSAVLKIADLTQGSERVSRTIEGRHIQAQLVFHPARPLLGFLGDNKLITIMNHETGEVLVEKGPQAHSVSFSTGDTVLYDDWYGKTKVFNYTDDTNHHLSPGWGSHASQSTRFITARATELHIRDTTDPSIDQFLPFDEIIECGLSADGRILAVRTDHVAIWNVASLLSEP